jgi:hypothetical protein
MNEVSWLGVLACVVASFVVGGLWYSPLLFANAWMRELGITPDPAKRGNMALIFAGMAALRALAAIFMSSILGPQPGLAHGFSFGLAVGFVFAAGTLGIHYLFEQRTFKLWLINGGSNVVTYAAFGAILGVL